MVLYFVLGPRLLQRLSYYKLLADYRVTFNIQFIKLEWPDILSSAKTSSEADVSSWGQDFFRGYPPGAKTSSEVNL